MLLVENHRKAKRRKRIEEYNVRERQSQATRAAVAQGVAGVGQGRSAVTAGVARGTEEPADYPLDYFVLEIKGVKLLALRDSGATRTFITQAAVDRAGLLTERGSGEYVVIQDFAGRGNNVRVGTAWVPLVLQNGVKLERVTVAPSLPQSVDILVGQDWITRYCIEVEDRRVVWRLTGWSFPITEPIALELIPRKKVAAALRDAERRGVNVIHATIRWKKTRAEEELQELVERVRDGRLRDVLRNYADVFEEPTGVVKRSIEQSIELTGNPQRGPLIPMSPEQLKELRKQLDVFLAKGWIRPSRSIYGSSIFLIPKKNGDYRFVIDYREVNRHTRPEKASTTRAEDIFRNLSGFRFFDVLDLRSGYYQVPMQEDSIKYTAMRTALGDFEWVVCPMGLMGAPGTFTRVVTDALWELLGDICYAFMDDLLIVSRTEEERARNLARVLQALRDSKLQVSASKCQIGERRVRFLGFVVSQEGVAIDPDRAKVFAAWTVPTSATELRRMLGAFNFYRKHVKDFATIAAPLHALTSDFRPILEGSPEHRAFHTLRKAMQEAPVLQHPRLDRPFTLRTDASEIGLGVELLQRFDGELRPVAFAGKALKLKRSEHAYLLELRAIHFALLKFHLLVDNGCEITILTDHQALESILRSPGQALPKRAWKYLDTIQTYANLKIVWVPAEQTVVADAISRSKTLIVSTAQVRLTTRIEEELKEALAEDPVTRAIVRRLNGSPTERESVRDYELRNGMLFFSDERGRRLVVPRSRRLRAQLLELHHDGPMGGHRGKNRLTAALLARYHWEDVRADVEGWVRGCWRCTTRKAKSGGKQPGLLLPLPNPSEPWRVVHLDLISGLPLTTSGNDAILLVVDRFTKRVVATPLRMAEGNSSAEKIADIFLRSVVRWKGVPAVIIGDRDPRWTAAFFKETWEKLGVSIKLSSAYRPQSNGLAERANRTLIEALRTVADQYPERWDEALVAVEFGLNTAQSSVGVSAFELDEGRRTFLPFDEFDPDEAQGNPDRIAQLRQLWQAMRPTFERARVSMAEEYDRNRREAELRIGDKVFVRADRFGESGKLGARWEGPFQVIGKPTTNSVKLKLDDSRKHDTFHREDVRPVQPDPWQELRPDAAPGPVIEDEYEVESIVAMRKRGKSTQYLVKWVGYEEPSWEDQDNVHSPRLIAEFKRRK